MNRTLDTDALEMIYQHTPRARGGYNPVMLEIETTGVLVLLGLGLRWINIVELARALIAHLDGGDFQPPSLTRFSPIKGFDKAITAEVVTPEEAAAFVAAAGGGQSQ